MALPNPVVQPPRVSRKTSTTPPPRVEDPREAARKARQRARWIEELRRNADARRAAGQAPPPGSDQDNSDAYVGTWEDPNYDKVRDGVTDQMGDFKGQIRADGGGKPKMTDWGNTPYTPNQSDQIRAGGGGKPKMTDWGNTPYTPNQSDQIRAGGGGGYDINMGMKDPRAGGLNKRTGVWTPPDPAYLEGLKNGTIEPEWKKRERMNGGLLQGGSPGPVEEYNVPGQSGEYGGINPGGGAVGGQKPQYQAGPGGTLGSQNGGPVGGAPVGGGRPGRQPPRPGQVSQQAARALYNDNTIPHDFKGQLMELARSGNAQSFNEALFGSGLPQETKMRLMELFGFGGGAGGGPTGGGGGVAPNPQGVPQPVPSNVGPPVPPNPRGSQYYGLY